MEDMLERVKKGEVVQRMITYMGKRIVEQFQSNKEHADRYDRYFLPANRDKSQAIQQNYALNILEVERLLNTKSE